jgi:hypothetical protein
MAEGDIGAVIDSLEFINADMTRPGIIHVLGNIFAITYTDVSGDGIVCTVNIANDGQIGAAVIDTLEFDVADGWEAKIIHVSGDVYAIAYRGVDADGFVCTVNIANDGQIGAAVIDTLEFETTACYEPDIIHIVNDIFAIVCRGAANEGIINTVNIANDGQIDAAVIDRKNGWATNVNNPQTVSVTGDVLAIVSRDNLHDGWIHTIGISSVGAIDATVIDSLEYDVAQGVEPAICLVLGDIYAIAYRGVGDAGFVCTVNIATNGQIGAAVIDSLEFDSVRGLWPDIIHIGDGICAIVSGGIDNDGFVRSVQIDAGGQIGAAVIDSLEYDTVKAEYSKIVHVSGNVYAIAYRGTGDDGFVCTIDIETPGAAVVQHLMVMGVG